MDFIAREKELELLEQEYMNESSLVLIYGKHKIGKTSLIREFIGDKRTLYFMATKEVEHQCLLRFSRALSDFIKHDAESGRAAGWEALLKEFADEAPHEKKLLIIDDLQFLLQVSPSFIEIIKNAWDKYFAGSNIMLILCGTFSSAAEPTDRSRNPNKMPYLNASLQIKLRPFRFTQLKEHFPDMPFSALFERYLVAGGSPCYFKYFFNDVPLLYNVEKYVLDRDAPLFDEPLNILEKDVRESTFYFSIMNAIANDHIRLSDIYGELEQKVNILSPYIRTLIDLDFLVKRVPINAPSPERSRKSRYYIRDGFLDFWFRFVYPYRNELELGRKDNALINLSRNLFSGTLRRNISYRIGRDIFLWLCQNGGFDFNPGETGAARIENKGSLPLVSFEKDTDRVISMLCRFNHSDPVSMATLTDLMSRSGISSELQDRRIMYGIFSKTGFDRNLIKKALELGNVLLVNEFSVVTSPRSVVLPD